MMRLFTLSLAQSRTADLDGAEIQGNLRKMCGREEKSSKIQKISGNSVE